MKATVLIPNWNGEKYLRTCLLSLQNQSANDFNILVVDNGSSDSSIRILREFPGVKVLSLPENIGFAGGMNRGIREIESEYMIFLNNDIECDKDFVKNLISSIEKRPKAFSVSARMIRYRERELLDDCGDLYTLPGFQLQRGTGCSVKDKKYLKPARVFSACGGAAIFRTSVLDKIGTFDEMHFAYLEDIDLGFRARIFGYQNYYEPTAIVYHIGSASSGSEMYNDFKVFLSARNNQYVIYKNLPLFFRGLNSLPLALGRLVKKRFFRKKGFSESYERGLREAKENRKNCRHIDFRLSNLPNYIGIEWDLIINTFRYLCEYRKRHL